MSLQFNSHKEQFLSDVIFGITLAGTSQRGNLYRREATTDERNKFRLALRRALENLAEQYCGPVTENRHVANINNLAKTLSKQHADALIGSRFRIGPAQKALNLYLKMLWCLDRIPPPQHCPFDRRYLPRALLVLAPSNELRISVARRVESTHFHSNDPPHNSVLN